MISEGAADIGQAHGSPMEGELSSTRGDAAAVPVAGSAGAAPSSRRRLFGARRVVLLFGVLAAGVPLQAVALPQPPSLLAAPPLPPQPGGPARSCLSQPPPPGWALVTRQRAAATVPLDASPLFPAPGYQIVVDPRLPCRMYRSRDAQTLEQSVDGGRTWAVVFHDTAVGGLVSPDPTCGQPQVSCALSSPAFTASSIDMPSLGVPGLIAFGERGNGDAAVMSSDGGTTWSLAGGSALSGHRVLQLAVARDQDPTHLVFGYAVTELVSGTEQVGGSGTQTVYITTDSGATWQPTTWPQPPGVLSGPPPATVQALTVVPGLPFLAFCVVNGNLYGAFSSSSSSGGPTQPMTWTGLGAMPDPAVVQLVFGGVIGRRLRMFAVGSAGDLHYADLDLPPQTVVATVPPPLANTTTPIWHRVALPPPVRVAAVAVSAFANQTLVAATDGSSATDRRVRIFYGANGALPVTEVPAPALARGAEASIRTPLLSAADANAAPDTVLQADNSGSFYLGVDVCAQVETGSSTCRTEEQSYWRYTSPTPSGTGATAGPGKQPGTQLPSELLTPVMTCSLGSAGDSSPLAFDGVDLIYPDPSVTPRAPYADALEVLDTRTCLTNGPRAVTVHFDPAEVRYAGCISSPCTQILIDDLAYDARRRVVWFVAQPQTGVGAGFNGYLFTAPWPAPDQPLITDVQAHVAFLPAHHENGCGGGDDGTVAYDVSDDSLWTCSYNSNGGGMGDHIRASDGADIHDHCYQRALARGSSLFIGVPGHQYWWDEDDTTIDDWSPATCSVVRSYVHAPVVEPVGEDEQLVCDPLTFTSLRGWTGPEATAFWLRESGLNRVDAFASSDAVCPLPTTLSLTTPLRIGCGELLTLTSHLQLEGPQTALPQQTVDFSIDGVSAGSAATDAQGTARLTLAAPPAAGDYSVTARYSGTSGLLPSTAGATLMLQVRPGCVLPTSSVRPVLPPLLGAAVTSVPPIPSVVAPHPAPGEAPAAQPAADASIQAQMQAQGQVHSMAQVQPGMMTQSEVRRQYATRTVHDGRVAPTLSDGPSNLSKAEGLAAVAAIMVLGWMPRSRRAVEVVEARSRRRRGRFE